MIGTLDPKHEFFFIAGPCLIEGEEMMGEIAETLSRIASQLDVSLILKGSFQESKQN